MKSGQAAKAVLGDWGCFTPLFGGMFHHSNPTVESSVNLDYLSKIKRNPIKQNIDPLAPPLAVSRQSGLAVPLVVFGP